MQHALSVRLRRHMSCHLNGLSFCGCCRPLTHVKCPVAKGLGCCACGVVSACCVGACACERTCSERSSKHQTSDRACACEAYLGLAETNLSSALPSSSSSSSSSSRS